MIKVLLADDHSIVRAGLRRIVEESGGMIVVAEAADGREAIQMVKKTAPDVAVIDISMPGLDGLEVVGQLQALHSKLPILVRTPPGFRVASERPSMTTPPRSVTMIKSPWRHMLGKTSK